mgnify:FL=1
MNETPDTETKLELYKQTFSGNSITKRPFGLSFFKGKGTIYRVEGEGDMYTILMEAIAGSKKALILLAVMLFGITIIFGVSSFLLWFFISNSNTVGILLMLFLLLGAIYTISIGFYRSYKNYKRKHI